MAFIHGKATVFKVNSKDISIYCKQSEWSDEADEHDVTGYGAQGHGYFGGLHNGKVTVSGTYDSTASTGPRAVLAGIVGTNVPVIRQPEGTGTTKPQDSATCHAKSYVETSPVADMVTWSAEFTVSGVTDRTPQT